MLGLSVVVSELAIRIHFLLFAYYVSESQCCYDTQYKDTHSTVVATIKARLTIKMEIAGDRKTKEKRLRETYWSDG